jgi:3-oxoacyl-[acyl-carrier protein] reductase
MDNLAKPLAGQTVLVTGATGGIGAAMVTRIAREGARVIIQYGRDRQKAEALLAHVGGNGFVVGADLAEEDGADCLWQAAVEAAGRVHALINNAGIRTEVPLDVDAGQWRAAWRREFQVNLFSAADLCRSAAQHFKEHGGGRIINIASRAGQRGYAADALPYGATKAALLNLSKSLASSIARDGVVTLAIAPGWVETEMASAYIARFGISAAVADIPIGEMAQPDEIAELVAFALRPSQRSLNGATLDVNGGSYLR